MWSVLTSEKLLDFASDAPHVTLRYVTVAAAGALRSLSALRLSLTGKEDSCDAC